MGGGGSSSTAGSGRGGGDLSAAAQAPREEEEARGAADMRARVCARVRPPQAVGAVLLVGGAIVGAALVAWRRRHACSRGCKDTRNHHGEQPATEEVLDGILVEDEQARTDDTDSWKVQGMFDRSDENLSKDDIGVGPNGLDGKATEELHQIQNSKATEELYEIREEDEIVTDGSDGEPVEKFDQNSSRESAEIIADNTDSGEMKNADENSSKSDVENEITLNATEGVDNSYQSTLIISSPEIVHEEHNEHNDGTQKTAPTQIILRTQTVMHHRQFSEEAKTDTVTETAEAELAKGTTMEKNVFEQEQKPLAGPAELATLPVSPSLPSLLKPSEKKGFANPGWNKTGMKQKQDCTNGELSKEVTTQGVAVVTMDRRAASMAILTFIFAVTIGVNIVVRLYSSLQAT